MRKERTTDVRGIQFLRSCGTAGKSASGHRSVLALSTRKSCVGAASPGGGQAVSWRIPSSSTWASNNVGRSRSWRGVFMVRWLVPLLHRPARAIKSPSGAAPEGQSRWYDQVPLGAWVTTDTTKPATAEARSSSEQRFVPYKIMINSSQVGPWQAVKPPVHAGSSWILEGGYAPYSRISRES